VTALRNSESSESFGVKFNETIGLKFAGNPTSMPELFGLLIEDVRSDGWEGVNYSVDERDFVSFRCRAVDPISSETLQPLVSFLKLVGRGDRLIDPLVS
jgi:hypothetical protein